VRNDKLADNNKRVRFDDLEDKPKNKKKFNLFDAFYSKRDRRDDLKAEWHERTFLYFFPLCWQNMTRLLYLNIIYVLGNFPIFLVMLALSRNLHMHATAPSNALYAPFYGAMKLGALSPASTAFSGMYGATTDVALWTPLARAVLIAGIVLLLGTFGPVTTGVTYIMRNIVKGEPIFLFNDFFYAIRRNLRQSIILGVIDLFAVALLAYDIYFFYLNPGLPLSGAFIVISLFLLVVCLVMRFYSYLMMITFDLSMFKILKNSLIFSLLGIGRNILAAIGIALVIVLNYGLAIIFLPLGVVLPFVLTVSLCMFIRIYAAWPKIKKVMIDPYYDENGNPIGGAQDGEDGGGADEDGGEGAKAGGKGNAVAGPAES